MAWGAVASYAAPYVIKGVSRLFGRKKKKKGPAAPSEIQRYNADIDSMTAEERAAADAADADFGGGQNAFADELAALNEYDPETAGLDYQDYDPNADFEGYDPNVDAPGLRGARSAAGGYRARDLEEFSPSDLEGVDVDSDLQGYGATESTRLLREGDGGPSAAAGFVPDSFDAGAAVKEYAGGAWGDTQEAIRNNLRELRGDAATGRLDTGFFDEDQGEVVRGLTDAFGRNVAQQAVNAAGITSASRTAASNQRLQALGMVDEHGNALRTNRANLARTADTTRLEALSSAARNRLTRAQGLTDAKLSRASDLGKLGLGAAEAGDRFTMDRERAIADLLASNADRGLKLRSTISDSRQRNVEGGNKFRLDAATATDATRGANRRFALGARGDNQALLERRASGRRDRAADLLTGQADRAQARANAAAERKDKRRSGWMGLAGNIGGRVLSHYINRKTGGGSTYRGMGRPVYDSSAYG